MTTEYWYWWKIGWWIGQLTVIVAAAMIAVVILWIIYAVLSSVADKFRLPDE